MAVVMLVNKPQITSETFDCDKLPEAKKTMLAAELAEIKSQFMHGLDKKEFRNLIFPKGVSRNELTIWKDTSDRIVAYLDIKWYQINFKGMNYVITDYSTYSIAEYRTRIKPWKVIVWNAVKCFFNYPFSKRFAITEFSVFSYHMAAKYALEYYPRYKVKTPDCISELMISCCKKFGYPLEQTQENPFLINLAGYSKETHQESAQLDREAWLKREDLDVKFYVEATQNLNPQFKLLACFPLTFQNICVSGLSFGYEKIARVFFIQTDLSGTCCEK